MKKKLTLTLIYSLMESWITLISRRFIMSEEYYVLSPEYQEMTNKVLDLEAA